MHGHLNVKSVNMLWKHWVINILLIFFLDKYTYVPYWKNIYKNQIPQKTYSAVTYYEISSAFISHFSRIHICEQGDKERRI